MKPDQYLKHVFKLTIPFSEESCCSGCRRCIPYNFGFVVLSDMGRSPQGIHCRPYTTLRWRSTSGWSGWQAGTASPCKTCPGCMEPDRWFDTRHQQCALYFRFSKETRAVRCYSVVFKERNLNDSRKCVNNFTRGIYLISWQIIKFR